MALSIRLFTPEASALLDRIDTQYRRPPHNEAEFFDRDTSDGPTAAPQDEPLTYFVDAWGSPFEYYSSLSVADGATDREKTSTFFHGVNRGRALLVSNGPTGASPHFANPETRVTLVTDLNDQTPGVIDNPLNADNVYIDDTLKDRMANPPE